MKLGKLRPVTFHPRTDPQGALQYGLIAEEVAKVYPELVIRDASGQIDGVRYDELAPMLLNEMQLAHRRIAAQAAEIRNLKEQQRQIAARFEHLDAMQQQLIKLRTELLKHPSKDELLAHR